MLRIRALIALTLAGGLVLTAACGSNTTTTVSESGTVAQQTSNPSGSETATQSLETSEAVSTEAPSTAVPTETTNSEHPPIAINERGMYSEAPAGISDDWKSLTFAIAYETYDWLNKPLSNVDAKWQRVLSPQGDTVLPGTRHYVGLTLPELQADDHAMGLIQVAVLNPNRFEAIPIEEATVVHVKLDGSSFLSYMINTIASTDPTLPKGYLLPKGLVYNDPEERLTELYGEPTEKVQDITTFYTYLAEKKSMILETLSSDLHSATFQVHITPDYVKEATEAIKEHPNELTKDSYLSIGGYHVKMHTPFIAAKEALYLTNYERDEEVRKEEDAQLIEPQQEITYQTVSQGYDNQLITWRLYNPGEEPISIDASTVIGIQVSLIGRPKDVQTYYLDSYNNSNASYLEIATPDYHLPTVGNYGVVLGAQLEPEFQKIPDEIDEKGQEGSITFATEITDGMRFQVYGRIDEQRGFVDSISLTIVLGE